MIRVVTDSVASLLKDTLLAENIEAVSLFVNHNDVEYVESKMDPDDLYRDIYTKMDNIPALNQPSQAVFKGIAYECNEPLKDKFTGNLQMLACSN